MNILMRLAKSCRHADDPFSFSHSPFIYVPVCGNPHDVYNSVAGFTCPLGRHNFRFVNVLLQFLSGVINAADSIRRWVVVVTVVHVPVCVFV